MSSPGDDDVTTASADPSSYARFRRVVRFGSLDGLRFLAVVPVVFHHSTPRPLPGVLGKGPIGVDLFFAVSGFLITTLLLRERDSAGRIDVRAFYTRRAFRILPLYYAVLALTVLRALALPVGSVVRSHFFTWLPAFATFTTTWFVDFGVPHPILFAYSWSLAVEEQFYAVFPWFARGPKVMPWLFAAGLLACDAASSFGVLTPIASGSAPLGLLVSVVTGIRAPLLLGVLLACILHEPRGYALVSEVLGKKGSSAVFAALLVVVLVRDDVPLVVTHLVIVCFLGSCVMREDHVLAKLLAFRPIAFVGEVSYGIYMLHLAAIFCAKRVVDDEALSGLWVFVLAFPLSVVFAAASRRFFEEPVSRLRGRLVARSTRGP
jgi:peptidoglycan/LPS O-acetylase OafA/YrhL